MNSMKTTNNWRFLHNKFLQISCIQKLLVFSLSVLLTLFMLEILLHLCWSPKQIYQNLWYYPEINKKHYQYIFLDIFSNHKYDCPNFDAELGWDNKTPATQFRGRNIIKDKAPGVERILFIGDSYTRGNEVKKWETFPYYVSKILPNKEILNMGVSGYGIDQTFLKFTSGGINYSPDMVFFGINPSNYERASLDFTYAAKPKFILDKITGEIHLLNNTILSPQESFQQIKSDLGLTLFLNGFVKSRISKIPSIRKRCQESFTNRMDTIVQQILMNLKTISASHNIKPYIIHIPGGHVFKDKDSLLNHQQAVLYQHLLQIYGATDIPYIDLQKEFLSRYELSEIYNTFYFHRTNKSIGHFTPKGNQAAANIILDKAFDIQIKVH